MGAVLVGAARFQVRSSLGNLTDVAPLVAAPLFTIVLGAILQATGRGELLGHAVLAPLLITLWTMALYTSGEIIDQDRHQRTLESVVATPAPFGAILIGRIVTVTVAGTVALAESWAAAWLVFGYSPTVHHPGVFVTGVAATVVATAGTSLILVAVFVLARSARMFQMAMTYPFYLLGGVVVPVALLPDWVHPVARAVYLSWSADLLRDTLQPQAVADAGARLGVILALGAAGAVVGAALLRRILGRLRRTGELGLA